MKTKICVIAVILAIGFVFCAYASAETGIGLIATGTSRGISLEFSNIPEDAVRLWVSLFDITTNDQILTYADIRGSELAELKISGSLLCPFVKDGHEYFVTVSAFDGIASYDYEEFCYASAIAGGGIHLTNNPTLYFTDENSSITLSVKPIFSEEGVYSQQALFRYSVFVSANNGGSYGGGGKSNDFTYDALQVINGVKEHFGLTGDLPVVGSVHCNLNYGNLEWEVGIARTEEVIVSF